MWRECFMLLILANLCLSRNYIDECPNVVKSITPCITDEITLSCPPDHGIRMIKANWYAAEDVCMRRDRRDCRKGYFISQFTKACTGKTTCTVPKSAWEDVYARSQCTNLDPARMKDFVDMQYICIKKTQPMNICSTEKRKASSVYLLSHPEGRTIQHTACTCTITVPKNTSVILTPITMIKTEDPLRLCHQHINLPFQEICTAGDLPFVECAHTPKAISLAFVNEGKSTLGTYFAAGIAAPDGLEFEIECGVGGTSYQGVGEIVYNPLGSDTSFGTVATTTTSTTTSSTTTPTTTTMTTTTTTPTTTTTTPTTTTTTPTTTPTTTTPTTTTSTTTPTPTTTTMSSTTIPTTTPTTSAFKPPKTTTTDKDAGNEVNPGKPGGATGEENVVFYEDDQKPFPKETIIATGVGAAVVILAALIAGGVLYARRSQKPETSDDSKDDIYDEPAYVSDKDPTMIMAMPVTDHDVAINPMYGKSPDIFAY